jgi:hypothetical protein
MPAVLNGIAGISLSAEDNLGVIAGCRE